MNDTNLTIEQLEKKIALVLLMIEKRKDRILYYDKLIDMGLTASDTIKLQFQVSIKESEIKALEKELDWLYMQKAFYEL